MFILTEQTLTWKPGPEIRKRELMTIFYAFIIFMAMQDIVVMESEIKSLIAPTEYNVTLFLSGLDIQKI
jgi:hypothetical protein